MDNKVIQVWFQRPGHDVELFAGQSSDPDAIERSIRQLERNKDVKITTKEHGATGELVSFDFPRRKLPEDGR